MGKSPRRRVLGVVVRLSIVAIGIYFVVAYLIVPAAWRRTTSRHPALTDAPRVSRTHDGIPGDPLNVALVGKEEELAKAMQAAGWHPADPITFRSSLRIAKDTVLRRPDVDAPVSNLFVWGRKQDLAYEQPVGHDPRQRHHVRFWRSEQMDDAGRPLWIGGATYDSKVGFSHKTGQITHHIDPDLDKERDKLLHDLQQAGTITETYWIDGFNPQLEGRNGGGDPYHTDGRLPVGELSTAP